MPCSTPRSQLDRWMHSYRHAFQQACFDLIDLMRIDWHAGFSCRCALRWYTADAIAVGMKMQHCFIERPHEAAADGDRVAGNTLQTRVFVPQPDMRRKLLLLGSSTSGGLSAAALQLLRASLNATPDAAHERTLLPLLESTEAASNGNRLAVAHWRRTVHSLGSTAPADQLLPDVLWPVATELLDGGVLSAAQERSFWQCSPLLYEALRPSLGAAALDQGVGGFLAALLKVGTDFDHYILACPVDEGNLTAKLLRT